jgi:hypothetical protein
MEERISKNVRLAVAIIHKLTEWDDIYII